MAEVCIAVEPPDFGSHPRPCSDEKVTFQDRMTNACFALPFIPTPHSSSSRIALLFLSVGGCCSVPAVVGCLRVVPAAQSLQAQSGPSATVFCTQPCLACQPLPALSHSFPYLQD